MVMDVMMLMSTKITIFWDIMLYPNSMLLYPRRFWWLMVRTTGVCEKTQNENEAWHQQKNKLFFSIRWGTVQSLKRPRKTWGKTGVHGVYLNYNSPYNGNIRIEACTDNGLDKAHIVCIDVSIFSFWILAAKEIHLIKVFSKLTLHISGRRKQHNK